MAEERSLDSEFTPTVTVAEGWANGTGDAAEPTADAAAEPTADATESTADAPADGGTEWTAEASTDDAPAADARAESTSSPDFLSRLLDAMRATVGGERERAAEDIERRRAAAIAQIDERRQADAARMRDLAAEDRRAIDAWADAELRRVESERRRRTGDLDADLQRSLEEHHRQVDAQVQAVEAAIAVHRADVDAFLGALESETDPLRIAQLANDRPVFPAIDEILPATGSASTAGAPAAGANALAEVAPEPVAAEAAATEPEQEAPSEPEPQPQPEPALVGVMDPLARLGLLTDDAPEAQPDPAPQPETAPQGEAVPVAAGFSDAEGSRFDDTLIGVEESAPGPRLAPVPAGSSGRLDDAAARPASSGPTSGVMGWLRRINEPDDR